MRACIHRPPSRIATNVPPPVGVLSRVPSAMQIDSRETEGVSRWRGSCDAHREEEDEEDKEDNEDEEDKEDEEEDEPYNSPTYRKWCGHTRSEECRDMVGAQRESSKDATQTHFASARHRWPHILVR